MSASLKTRLEASFRSYIWIGIAVAASMAANSARAQSESYFDRNNNVSVRDRPRPDYEALGVNLGSFVVYPRLTVGEEYDTNIYATPQPVQSDNVLFATPEVNFRSTWSRNEVTGYARVNSANYIDHTGESNQNFQLGVMGRLDILTSDSITANASFSHSTEPRTSENTIVTAIAPIQYDQFVGGINGNYELAKLRLSGGVGLQRFAYYDTTDFSGHFLQQGNRDENTYLIQGRADYAISPAVSLFVSTIFNDQVYDLSPPQVLLDRNSSGFVTTVGTDFDITRLVRGQFQIGFLDQSYASSSFHSIGGLATSGRVEYFLSGLTTLTFTVNRSVQDAGDPRAVSYVLSSGGVQVDHELLRNVILTANFLYQNDSYRGIDRGDNRFNLGVSGTYLMNRHIGVNAGYSYLRNTSYGTDRIFNYVVNQFTVSLVFQL